MYMYEPDVPVCGICGDTGWVWGDPKNGRCETCYDEGLEDEESEKILEKAFTKVEKSRIVRVVVETLAYNQLINIA